MRSKTRRASRRLEETPTGKIQGAQHAAARNQSDHEGVYGTDAANAACPGAERAFLVRDIARYGVGCAAMKSSRPWYLGAVAGSCVTYCSDPQRPHFDQLPMSLY